MEVRKMALSKIDTNKVNFEYKHTDDYSVYYYVYKAKNSKSIKLPTIDERGKRYYNVCFANLLDKIKTNKTSDSVLYTLFDDKRNINLTLDEKKEWIKMARKYKFLPKYVRYSSCATEEGGNLVLKINDIQPSLLYLYLTVFRHIRDDPGLVKCMLHLVNECEMDFYLAYTISCRICVTNSGHSLVNYTRGYMEKSNINNLSINVSIALALVKFINDVERYDCKSVKKDGFRFNCSEKIEKLLGEQNVTLDIEVAHMLKPKFKTAMKTHDAENIKKAIKYIKGMEKNGKNKSKDVKKHL